MIKNKGAHPDAKKKDAVVEDIPSSIVRCVPRAAVASLHENNAGGQDGVGSQCASSGDETNGQCTPAADLD